MKTAPQPSVAARAWQLLKTFGPMRGSDLGWMLWGDSTAAPGRGTGSHGHNKFCRPAGKVLKQLEREGKACWQPRENHSVWIALGNSYD